MAADDAGSGRGNQRLRTRKDLLQAASRMIKAGHKPSLEEVAAEALVSRATAYRYFPTVDALLLEASLDVVTPEAAALFGSASSTDPVERLEQLDAAMHEMTSANEGALRLMLAASLDKRARTAEGADVPARQNRRSPLIAAALAPARRDFAPAALRNLEAAMALVIGTESMIVFKDVLRTDDEQARRVKRWMIRALVEYARKPGSAGQKGTR